uniref:Putative sodium/sulfate symporter n=1 Tax=Helianthus annuus TaxID=4232 RepID=A0A251S5N8_HELAN
MAKNKLEQIGLVKRNEWIWMMLGTTLVTITLWIFGVESWDDFLSEKAAWNTLTWFAVFLGMADQPNILGVIPWFSRRVGSFLKSLAGGWYIELLILETMYFFIHYLIVG